MEEDGEKKWRRDLLLRILKDGRPDSCLCWQLLDLKLSDANSQK